MADVEVVLDGGGRMTFPAVLVTSIREGIAADGDVSSFTCVTFKRDAGIPPVVAAEPYDVVLAKCGGRPVAKAPN